MGIATTEVRWRAAVAVIFCVLAGACGSGQDVRSDTASEPPTETVVEPTVQSTASAEPGVLTSWTAGLPRDRQPPAPPEGELSITKCSWHGPGRWSAELAWYGDFPPTPEQPVEVLLGVGFGADPARIDPETMESADGPLYGVTGGTARLTGNGSFTVPLLSGSPFGSPGVIDGWWAYYPAGWFAPSGLCGVYVIGLEASGPNFDAGVEVAFDPQRLYVDADLATNSSVETVESLAVQVPLTPAWREHPMAALALLATTEGVPIDQLFFDPTTPIGSIDVKHIAPCVVVTIGQHEGTVRQTQGCESLSLRNAGPDFDLTDATAIETLGDGRWIVEAVGTADLVGSIRAHTFLGGVDPSTADQLDSEAAVALGLLEGEPDTSQEVQEPQAPVGWTALGSYELVGGAGQWLGEQVEVWFDTTGDQCCVVYEVEVDGFNGGSTGTTCRDWAISLHDDGQRGFVVAVVAGEQTVRLVVDAEPIGVPLKSTADEASNIRAGVVDAPFDFSAQVDWLSRVQVLEPDGSRSPCLQN